MASNRSHDEVFSEGFRSAPSPGGKEGLPTLPSPAPSPADHSLLNSITVQNDIAGDVVQRNDSSSGQSELPFKNVHPEAGGAQLFAQAVSKTIADQAQLLDLANDAILIRELDGKITYWNKGAERMYGWTAAEVLGKRVGQLLHTVYPEPLEQITERLSLDGHWEGELEHTRRDGSRIVVASRWSLHRDRNGELLGWLQLNSDITERKRSEEALRQSERRLSLALESAQTGIWELDLVNHTAVRSLRHDQIFGYGSLQPEWTYEIFMTHVVPEDRESVKKRLEEAHATGQFSVECRIIPAVGNSLRCIAVQGRIHRDDRGKPIRMMGVVTDITQRKRVEHALREREDHYRSIIETANDAFVGMDSGGLITDWNRQAESVFGWPSGEVIGRAMVETLIPPRHREAHRKGFQHFLSAGDGSILNKRIEMTALHRNGHEFPVELTIWPIRAAERWSFNAFIRDITERKQAQKAIQEAEELERRTTEITLLSQLGSLLQTCLTTEEAYSVIGQLGRKLFPAGSGALCVLSTSRTLVEVVAGWGDSPVGEQVFAPDDCWALRSGHIHFVEDPKSALVCRHVARDEASFYLCVPLVAQGDALGILHLRGKLDAKTRPEASRDPLASQQLALAVAEQIGLALANLKLRDKLRTLSVRDPLTGLFNRRYMEESLERELLRAGRRSGPLGIILLDIDRFKGYNDTLGHEAGDSLLRELANFLQANVRGEDIACRYGGDEFIVILPDAALEISLQRAEQIRKGVKQLNVRFRGQPLGTVTLSLGVAVYPEHGMISQTLLRSADNALYEAKKLGRDRTVVSQSDQGEGSV